MKYVLAEFLVKCVNQNSNIPPNQKPSCFMKPFWLTKAKCKRLSLVAADATKSFNLQSPLTSSVTSTEHKDATSWTSKDNNYLLTRAAAMWYLAYVYMFTSRKSLVTALKKIIRYRTAAAKNKKSTAAGFFLIFSWSCSCPELQTRRSTSSHQRSEEQRKISKRKDKLRWKTQNTAVLICPFVK